MREIRAIFENNVFLSLNDGLDLGRERKKGFYSSMGYIIEAQNSVRATIRLTSRVRKCIICV